MGTLRTVSSSLTLLCLFLAVAAGASAQVIFVDASASGANDGSSWADAYTDLQTALAASAAGDEVWVAAGMYTPSDFDTTASFFLQTGVALYGGFAGVETARNERDWDANATILSGDVGRDDVNGIVGRNCGHVVVASGTDASTTLDGFTVSDGAIGPSGTPAGDPLMYGSGIYMQNGSPTVRNCRIANNLAAFASGGGMYCWDSSPTVRNCQFIGNYVHLGNGGGIADYGNSAPLIEDCLFQYNTCVAATPDASGGGIHHYGTLPMTLRRCTFDGNVVQHFYAIGDDIGYGGGLSNFGSEITVVDCIFKNNRADYGGGMITWQPATVVNSLFINNTATVRPRDPYPEAGGYGGGLAVYAAGPDLLNVVNCTVAYNHGKKYAGLVALWNGRMDVHNTIVWGNTSTHPEVVGYWTEQLAGFSNISYSCIPHIFEPHGPGEDPIDPANLPGVIDAEPLFVQPSSNGNLRLVAGSPCIDAGDNGMVPGGIVTDLCSSLRFVDDPATVDTGAGAPPLVDMGAYERPASPRTPRFAAPAGRVSPQSWGPYPGGP